MFIGTYNHSIDSKNRMLVPSKVKATLGEAIFVYLSLGFDGNIDMRLDSEFNQFVNNINNLSIGSKEARNLTRLILSQTYKIEIDSASRILIPQNLIDKAKIKKDIYIIGTNDRYEIWAKEVYDDFSLNQESTLSDLAEKLLINGI